MSDKSYGPVQDGRISHLAVTGVAQFNVDEEGCPSRWFYKNVEKRPEPERVWHTKGGEVDDQINHYLPTGQNVLGKTARAGLHLLPEPGTDLLVQWGLNNKLREKKPDGRWKNFFPPEESLLWAAGIPFVGFPDVINARQQYLVPSDDSIHQKVELRSEPGVVEVLDNKTTSDFKWAKSSDKLLQQTQMNGYGLFVLEIDSGITGVRLSHNTYRTDERMAPAAIKRSALVSAKEIRDRWTGVVEPIVEQMKSVAGMKRDVDVPYNLKACESFGGCPHKSYCHAHSQLNPLTRMKMSLLKNRPAAAPAAAAVPNGATPWIPPQPPAPPGAAALPIMQTAPQPPAPPAAPPAYAAPQPAPVAPLPAPAPQPQAVAPIAAGAAVQNSRYWVNGQLMQYLCMTNGKQAFMFVVNGQMTGTPLHIPFEALIVPALPDAVGVAPPAQASQSVAPPPAPVAVAPPPAPAAHDVPQPAKRGRPRKLATQDDSTPAAPTAAAAAAPVSAVPPQHVPVAAANAPVTGLNLYVNAVPNGPFTDLSGFVHEAVEQIRAQFGVADVRVAPDDSPIAFAKWRGVLAGLVRAEPPGPGTYVAFTSESEFMQVAVEALVPLCGAGFPVRGLSAR